MFIKLHFIDQITSSTIPIPFSTTVRIIKISRIQEIRPSYHNQSEILLTGEPQFLPVTESITEIFGSLPSSISSKQGEI